MIIFQNDGLKSSQNWDSVCQSLIFSQIIFMQKNSFGCVGTWNSTSVTALMHSMYYIKKVGIGILFPNLSPIPV